MPYDIRKFEKGYKVCKKGTSTCYSNDPIPKKRAIAQRKAIAISKYGGSKLLGCGFFDDEDFTKIVGSGFYDDEDFTKLVGEGEPEDILAIIQDLPDNEDHFAIDEPVEGGDFDWWGLAKDVGSDLLKSGKDFVVDNFGTEEAKEAKRKKEEACKICNEGSGMSGGDFFDDENWELMTGGDIDWGSLANIAYDLIKPNQKDQGYKPNKRKEGDDKRNWGYDEEDEYLDDKGKPISKEEYYKQFEKKDQPLFGDPTQFKPQPYDPNNPLMYMVGGAIPINKKLYEKAKSEVYPKYKKPSAYRSGAVVKRYKELGGKFKEDGERKLKRWFEEEWKDIGKKNYPVYRPSKRITKDTPLTPGEIDPENLKLQIEEKQKIKGEKNLKPFEAKEGSGISANSGFYRTDPKRFKGGALYAKDKYATGEKELTPIEKKIVKQKMGEGNPVVAEIAREPMGDDDIRKYFPNAKIMKYAELSKYSDISQLLPRPKTFFFLLYEREPNVGHWVLVSRYNDNGLDTLEFFCSYGSKVDAPLLWTPIGMRVQLGQDKPLLSMLFDKSKLRVVYNPIQFQSKKSPISTCGAYDTLRASELQKHNTTLEEFNDMLEEVKKATGLNYDEIVSNLVHLR